MREYVLDPKNGGIAIRNESDPRCDVCNDLEGICQACCQHFENDHGICLDCGKDLTE